MDHQCHYWKTLRGENATEEQVARGERHSATKTISRERWIQFRTAVDSRLSLAPASVFDRF